MSKTWRRVCWFILGCLGTGLFVAVLYLLLQGAQTTGVIRSQQKTNQSILVSTKQAARDAAKSARLIKSCVRPGGKCHQRGVKQTGEAVGQIGRVVVLSASCTAKIATATHGLEGISQTGLTKLITACVRSQLAIEAQRAP